MSCRAGPEERSESRAQAVEGGVELIHTHSRALERVEVLDSAGRILRVEQDLPRSGRHFLPVPPELAAAVRLEAGTAELLVEAQEFGSSEGIRIRTALPMGAQPSAQAELRASARHGSRPRILAMVDVSESTTPQPLDLALDCGGGPTVHDGPRNVISGQAVLMAAITLPEVPDRGLDCLVLVRSAEAAVVARSRLRVDPTVAVPQLSIVEVVVPADPRGRADPSRPADTLRLPDLRFRALRAVLGLGGRPVPLDGVRAEAAVRLRNGGETATTALIYARLLDPSTGKPAPAFRPRAVHTHTGAEGSVAMLRVPAGAEAVVLLPLHANRDARPGALRLQIELHALGEQGAVDQVERPIEVLRSRGDLSLGFGLLLLLSLVGFVPVLFSWRAWADGGLPMESVVFIALIGALLAVYHTGAYLASSLFFTLLGPLDVLFMGSLGSLVQTLLLTVLVLRVPRAGALSLALFTSTLLRGMVSGHLGPAELIFVLVAASIPELFLWVLGIFRRPVGTRPGRIRLLLALVPAAMLVQAGDLLLYRVLYRLDFAAWYVALVVLVLGFLAVVPGVLLGVRTADDLRRVSP